MIEVNLYKQDGSKKGNVSLSADIFSLPWNDGLVHQAVITLENSMRSGNAHTKDRSEVRGGGKKPWKQKGTGRARHGSIRSPIWVGGGTTFGPRSEKDFTNAINKKMRVKAFFIALSQKLRDEKISFIDDISFESPSTKNALALVSKVCNMDSKNTKNLCTIVFADSNAMAQKSFSNIPGVRTVLLDVFNTRDVLIAKQILFVNPDETIARLETRGSGVKNVSATDKGDEGSGGKNAEKENSEKSSVKKEMATAKNKNK